MRENQAVPVRKGAIVFYVLITVLLLAVGTGYYVISSYYPLEYEEMIVQYAEERDLEPELVCAIIATESRFNPEAKSHKGAMGLMQLMPDTGEWISGKLKLGEFTEDDLKNPEISIRMGTWYLDFLEERFDGERDTVIAAYNAGHGKVDTWLEEAQYSADGRTLDVIPYKETKDYVKKVNLAYEIYKTFYKVG